MKWPRIVSGVAKRDERLSVEHDKDLAGVSKVCYEKCNPEDKAEQLGDLAVRCYRAERNWNRLVGLPGVIQVKTVAICEGPKDIRTLMGPGMECGIRQGYRITAVADKLLPTQVSSEGQSSR
jgi:hypothetical protein